MQCDKCKYTTHHNSFLVHHIRDNVKQKVFCEKYGMQLSEDQKQVNHEGENQKQHNEMVILKEHEKEKGISPKDLNEDVIKTAGIEKNGQQNISMLSLHTYSQLHIPNESIPIIRLSNAENFQIPNILEHDELPSSDQPMYVRVLQHINVNENFMHPTELTSTHNDDMMVKVKDSSTKQLLTLTEDGNLEMVEVSCWNDVQPGTPDADTDMHF